MGHTLFRDRDEYSWTEQNWNLAPPPSQEAPPWASESRGSEAARARDSGGVSGPAAAIQYEHSSSPAGSSAAAASRARVKDRESSFRLRFAFLVPWAKTPVWLRQREYRAHFLSGHRDHWDHWDHLSRQQVPLRRWASLTGDAIKRLHCAVPWSTCSSSGLSAVIQQTEKTVAKPSSEISRRKEPHLSGDTEIVDVVAGGSFNSEDIASELPSGRSNLEGKSWKVHEARTCILVPSDWGKVEVAFE
ncbi:hypothetical protein AXG93_1593s1310 [Marchantia polymorpha subsp. ruderalis]|uniref:Uncharacterized protein n=1 Tax=Marchantia polymorpha subsp. ruderalis TaxID=1480154 RepID=A0A176WPE4_MARPO|nr:hypothetical protein AXG93_1593s1310 [Marchantia polymorpha subsp. ruderalis]